MNDWRVVSETCFSSEIFCCTYLLGNTVKENIS